MKARVIDSFPAPTLDEIKRFEARNGVVLPEEYVEFLFASNAGLFTGEYALVGPPGGDERRRYQSLNRRRSGRRSSFERRRDAFGELGEVFTSTSRDRIDQTRRPLRLPRRGAASA